MHQMRLTNKQIQEILTSMRQQLKNFKTRQDTLQIDWKMPTYKEHDKARLIILPTAWEKMIALIDECDKEIAWHGLVTKTDNTYTITDILIFPQTVTGCTVTSDETEYSLWLANQPDNVFNSMRFHGHSHVNMATSPSGVDTSYQEDILQNLKDFYIFGIFNKKGDHWCAIYDVESNIAYSNADIELITPNTGNTAWAKEAIKSSVKFPETKVHRDSTGKFVSSKAAAKPLAKKSLVEELQEDLDYGPNDEQYYDRDGYEYGYGYGYYGGYYGQK